MYSYVEIWKVPVIIVPYENSLAVSFVGNPFSLVDKAAGVVHFAIALSFVISPLARVDRAVCIVHFAITLSCITFHLALVEDMAKPHSDNSHIAHIESALAIISYYAKVVKILYFFS